MGTKPVTKKLSLSRNWLIAILAVLIVCVDAVDLNAQRRGRRVRVPRATKGIEAPKGTVLVDETQEQDSKDDEQKERLENSKPKLPGSKEKGPIQDLRKQLNKLIDLKWNQGQLEVGTKTNYESVDSIMDEIREVVGYGGGSSYSGTDEYRFDLNSEKTAGRVQRETVDGQNVTTVLLEETVKPFRTLLVKSFADGRIQASLTDSQAAYMLRINQDDDGTFLVQELDGVNVFADEAADFESFCRRHREFATDRLLPMMRHCGMGNVLTPYSTTVQKEVANMLAPWSDGDLEKIKTLTANLNSRSYVERMEAFKNLESTYRGNEEILARMVNDASFPPETRATTRRLIRDKIDEEKLSELDFIDSIVNSLDAAYLVDLLQTQSDPEVRSNIVSKLMKLVPELSEELKGQQDVVSLLASQTLNAIASDQVTDSKTETKIDLLKPKGKIDKITSHIGKLVKLVWHEDQLKVDRQHWKKPFQGQSIGDINKEIAKLLKEKNLPEDWYQPGGAEFTGASAKHPQVLFEKMEEVAGKTEVEAYGRHHYGGYSGNNTLDRAFEKGKLKCELSFKKPGERQGESNGSSVEKRPFRFQVAEQSGSKRTLLCHESKVGELRIVLMGEKPNFVVQLILQKDSAVVQDVRGSTIVAYQASSFRELLNEEPEYCRDSLFPLLRHVGIEVDSAVDAKDDSGEKLGSRN